MKINSMLEPDVFSTLYILFTFGVFIDTVTFGEENFSHLYDLLVPYGLGADIHLINCDD